MPRETRQLMAAVCVSPALTSTNPADGAPPGQATVGAPPPPPPGTVMVRVMVVLSSVALSVALPGPASARNVPEAEPLTRGALVGVTPPPTAVSATVPGAPTPSTLLLSMRVDTPKPVDPPGGTDGAGSGVNVRTSHGSKSALPTTVSQPAVPGPV